MENDEQLLTSEYLNSLIKASEAADELIKKRGWTSDDDAWDDLGPRGQLEWAMAEVRRAAALLARVILAETVIWRKDDVVARYQAGERSRDIALDTGITEQTVTSWARSAGVRLRSPGRPPGAKDKTKRKVSNVKPRSND
jgi:hypothetical protein